MALFQSLKKVARNPNSKTFLTFHLTPSLSSTPFPFPSHNNFLSPITKWVSPFQGPLFLSSPPWKLCQLATPLYQQSDVVFLIPKLHSQCLLPKVSNLGCGLSLDGKDNNELRGFKESFLNLPNFISITRLVSGPFLGWMIIQEMYLPAFVGLAISGATDWLDGYVARKMGINSVVGSYLDPLADKVLIGCVALAMVDKGLLHSGLVGLIVVRDVALVAGAVYNRASSLDWEWKNWSDFFNLDGTRPQKVEPLFLSKVNTVFQLVLVTAALLQPEFGTHETQSYVTYLSWLVGATTIASTAAYGAQHLKSTPLVRKNL